MLGLSTHIRETFLQEIGEVRHDEKAIAGKLDTATRLAPTCFCGSKEQNGVLQLTARC